MAYQLTSNIKFTVWQTYIGLWSERGMQAFWSLLSILLMSLGIVFLLRLDEWPIEFIFVAGCFVFVGYLQFRQLSELLERFILSQKASCLSAL